MATLEQLQAQRTQIINEIQRRGGKGKAPGFEKQLADIEAQIRTTRGTQQGAQNPAINPPVSQNVNSAIQGAASGDVLKNTGTAAAADAAVTNIQANQNLQLGNPNVNNPYGSSTTTRDPVTGDVTIDQKLSQDQQDILDKDETISKLGRDAATRRLNQGGFTSDFNPTTRPSFGTGDLMADRNKVEDALYARNTRDFDLRQKQERDRLEQSLADRGIPRDPRDPQYAEAMRQFDQRYDDLRTQARNDATIQGGQEYATMFGIGETGKANDFSQGLTTRQQNLSEISGLSGIGTGVQNPNFPGYQAPQVQYSLPSDIAIKLKELGLNEKQINAAISQMKSGGGGGRSSGGTAPAPADPFHNSLPPGY